MTVKATVMLIFLCLSLYLHCLTNICALQQNERSVYRFPNGELKFVNLRKVEHHYLQGVKITSSMVAHEFECAFLCADELKCFSSNVATFPDSKGFYMCELLSTDKYRTPDKLVRDTNFNHFGPWSPCESGPCKNGAVCVPEYEMNSYHCDCEAGFTGTQCERRARSCSEITSRNPNSSSGSYLIDPDGEGQALPFVVSCDMSDKNGIGVTIVGHDSEDRTLVTGFENPGSYVCSISYSGISNVSQLEKLVHASAHCEQFIKYECYNVLLLNNGVPNGWLVSRDGAMMKYWGGASSDEYKCACGEQGSCAKPGYQCNCDINDYEWREDSGILNKKSDLPVSQLRFGDTGHAVEKGYHTLGKLKCYGVA